LTTLPGASLRSLSQVHLVAAQLVEPQLIGRLAEVLGELGHRSQVMADCMIGIVTTLEFLQHHLA
jgi:hypothetical protein